MQRASPKNGFTLFESLLASLALGICLLGILAALKAGFTAIDDIHGETIAVAILQEEIEKLRKTSFASLPAVGEARFVNSSLARLFNSTGIVRADNYINAGILRITFNVSWYSPLEPDKERSKKITTLVSGRGINAL